MNTFRKESSNTLKDYEALDSGGFVFGVSLPISRRSNFGDSLWDWGDPSDSRLTVTQASKLRVNWSDITATKNSRKLLRGRNQLFQPILPKEIVEDLKRAFFIVTVFPSLVRSRRKRELKPISIVYLIRHCANFLSHVCSENLLNGRSRIKKLTDITINQVQAAIDTFPYRSDSVRKSLRLLAQERIQVNLKHGRLQWNEFDLKTLHWRREKPIQNIETLPDPLFALLSNRSCDLVSEFHSLLGRSSRLGDGPQYLKASRWPRFKEMFESYISRRAGTKQRRRGETLHTFHFVAEFNVSPKALLEFLFDVQTAAFNIILLYTGMRYSEVASLKTGCLTERNGVRLVKSSLIKNVPSNLPIDQDEWVAIDAVEDAVIALQEVARCNFNPFLFANFETLKDGKEARPITNSGLTDRLNKYLRKIDTKEVWRDWQLSPHQYRHGLVNQLARAEVGIPYITRQLKHCYTLLFERSYRLEPSSMIYGLQRQRLINNSTGLQAIRNANVTVANDLYGEGRNFAGGGAKLHVQRTEAFFRGIGLEGKARHQYIEKLAESGGGPIRTGVGFCVRNHVDPQKLKEAPPPCIGDLQCNPHTCVHSVVPEGRKADVITRYRYAAKQLDSPEQNHLRSHWEAELRAYAAMLEQLGIDPASVSGPSINPKTIANVLAARNNDHTPVTANPTQIKNKQLQ